MSPAYKTQAITWGALVAVIAVGLSLLAVVKDASATIAKIDAKTFENEARIERMAASNNRNSQAMVEIKEALAALRAGQRDIKQRLNRGE